MDPWKQRGISTYCSLWCLHLKLNFLSIQGNSDKLITLPCMWVMEAPKCTVKPVQWLVKYMCWSNHKNAHCTLLCYLYLATSPANKHEEAKNVVVAILLDTSVNLHRTVHFCPWRAHQGVWKACSNDKQITPHLLNKIFPVKSIIFKCYKEPYDSLT